MKQLIAFVAGAALGSLVTWKLIKDKYEKIAQEEIDSVKEVFSNKKGKEKPDNEEDNQVDEKDVEEYENVIESAGYTKYSDISNIKTKVEPKTEHEEVSKVDPEKPYIIRPDEFGEIDDYELISLTYYSDGVLADDDDEEIEDEEVDEVVGADFADHFGEYEDDRILVRNDRLKCDYEICFDQRKYSELHNITYHKGFPD